MALKVKYEKIFKVFPVDPDHKGMTSLQQRDLCRGPLDYIQNYISRFRRFIVFPNTSIWELLIHRAWPGA